MMIKKVKSMWNNCVHIRDYEKEKAIASGGLRIEFRGEYMDVSITELKHLKPRSNYSYQSQFHKNKQYGLIDILWRPDKSIDIDQMEMFK